MTTLFDILKKSEERIMVDWIEAQMADSKFRKGTIKETELRRHCQEFIFAFCAALDAGESSQIESQNWAQVREILTEVTKTRGEAGFTPAETATFIFSLKNPVFKRLRETFGNDSENLFREIWKTTEILDKLGLFTIEVYQKSRESIIARQQLDMLELSTPVIKLWDGVLALPMIGTLDSGRTQTVMESLLQKIVEVEADIAIIDITGVPTVDTLVAQHLMKTVTAARLMGAECIISGIRPQIAQTIVHLGVELNNIVTKANLADAFGIALSRLGLRIVSST